jgi:sugar lactone lactonase YvrE
MRSGIKRYLYLRSSSVLFLGLVMLLFSPAFASSAEEETYVFERMWPTLQQPWYFSPTDLASDSDGNIYISDSSYGFVTKLSPDGQFITRLHYQEAGLGTMDSSGITISPTGYFYAVDLQNNRIYKFTLDGEFISSWGNKGSGDGEFDFSYVSDTEYFHGGDIAIDDAGNIYVVDTLNNRIQKFDTEGNFITKWGSYGTGNGEFDRPFKIVIDDTGNIYVVDTANNRIQKFDSDGNFITKWGSYGTGNGEFYFDRDAGIAIDKNGDVYVTDRGNGRVQKFDSNGQFIETWDFGGQPTIDLNALAIDIDGNIYIGDNASRRVRKFSADHQFITKWGSSGTGDGELHGPSGITIDESGFVYVSEINNHRFQKFSPDGLYISKVEVDGQAGGIAVDGDRNVYVALEVTNEENRIQKYSPEGVLINEWGNTGSGDGEFNHGGEANIAIDKDGYIYVIDTYNYRIQKFTSDGEFVTKWGSQGTGDGEFVFYGGDKGIAIDSSGFVYVVDNNGVQKFTSDGEFVSSLSIRSYGLALDSNDNLILIVNHTICKYSPEGDLISEISDGYGAGPGQILGTYYLAISPDNKIYVSDLSTNRIQVFAPEGLVNDPADAQDENPETIPKAIIVAGGGPFPGNNLWDATQMCANYAYRALTYQGYTKNSIYYLSADTDLDLDGNGVLDDVDGDATNDNLAFAITTWAMDAEDLFIYMVDHGGEETFRMGATELLYAEDLDSWLDEIQETIPGTVTLLYDACQSGSFLPLLTPPSGKERIIATSASSDEEALFGSQGTVSFSFLFWARMFNGDSFYDSFVNAKNSVGMSYAQTSQIEANGNGVGNEDEDKLIAEDLKIGNETLSAGDIPVIGSVSPEQTLEGETSALIYAEDVIDANGISRVWSVITPPGYSPGSLDSPVTDLPVLDLGSVGDNCYEGTYDGFTEEGSYSIAIYASDGYGVISFPMPTEVTQTEGFSAWQLISLSQQPSDTNIDTVLDFIIDNVISVWAYENGSWQVYDPANPGFSDLETMEAGRGYWLHLSESATLTVSGSTPSNSIELTTGWNLVGYNSSIEQDIAEVMASIEGKYISVWAYIDGGWKVYDPENPGFSDLTSMEPGYGYWINAKEACMWTLP